MSAPPEISVVVITYNRPAPLRNCLASLAAQTLAHERFEVIVVDGSDIPALNRIEEFVDALTLQHIVRKNGGPAVGRNAGAHAARANFLAFIDDDCVASPDWIEKMHDALHSHPRSLVGGSVNNGEMTNVYALTGQAITEAVDDFYNSSSLGLRFFPGLNIAMARDLYWSIGGYDESFGLLAAEDRDLVDRWRAAGYELTRQPDAIVSHMHRGSLMGFARQYFNYGRGAQRYHSLRRQRGTGHMREDAGLHFHLVRHFSAPLAKIPHKSRFGVVILVGLWQALNVAGFLFQAMQYRVARALK